MSSDLSQRFFDTKIRTLFTRLDDGNGKLESDDLEKWAEKLISFGKNFSSRKVLPKKRNSARELSLLGTRLT